MGMTDPPTHAPLSPYKERRNRDFFLVIHWGGTDLKDSKSGIQREFSGNSRESWGRDFSGRPAIPPFFPPFPAEFPIFNR